MITSKGPHCNQNQNMNVFCNFNTSKLSKYEDIYQRENT